MIAGYVSLAVAGVTWAVGGPAYDGPAYDVVIHSVFLGFTISMIMAHAPVILPAVLRRPLPYHPALLVPAALLQASLVLRLWIGDGHEVGWALRTGGVLNVIALLGFVAVAIWSASRNSSPERARWASRPRPADRQVARRPVRRAVASGRCATCPSRSGCWPPWSSSWCTPMCRRRAG